MELPILMQEIFNLYWNRNLQLRTPNMGVIKIFLMGAKERGDNITLYHVNSNFSACYNIDDILNSRPAFLQVNDYDFTKDGKLFNK